MNSQRRFSRNSILLIAAAVVIVLLVSGFVLFNALRNNSSQNPPETSQVVTDSEIACPLEGASCAAAEVFDYEEDGNTYSTLQYLNSTQDFKIYAPFDGTISVQRTPGANIQYIEIENPQLNLTAAYIFTGLVQALGAEVKQGEVLGSVVVNEPDEAGITSNFTFNILNMSTGEKMKFERPNARSLHLTD